MAQPVTAIISQQGEIAARARQVTGDVNEAGLIVGKVMSRALRRAVAGEASETISVAMRRDLDTLIRQIRRSSV